jgi:membrane fusion protein, macrolide-specific efflux system
MRLAKRFYPQRRQALLLGLVAAAILLTAYAAWSFVGKPAPPKYTTAKVVRTDIENSILSSGVLQAVRQVDVGTRVTGQLTKLYVKSGDHAKAGDLLAEIDPTLPANALRAAQANLDMLEAQKRSTVAKLRRSRLEFERQRGLIKGDATSRKDLEAAEAEAQAEAADLAALEAQISAARSQVDIANANLAYTRITAPIEGDVIAIMTQEGQTVVATQVAPVILKLARLDAITVKIQMSEADILGVKVGQKASFTVMGDPDKRYHGVLRDVELAPQSYTEASTPQGGTQPATATAGSGAVFYSAWFDVPNPERTLRIGMTAQVAVIVGVAKGALAIPPAALRGPGANGRYLVKVLGADGRAETRQIGVGINNHAQAEALDGLKEGEDVITSEIMPGKEP